MSSRRQTPRSRSRARQSRQSRGRRLVFTLVVVVGFFGAMEAASRLREVWLPPIPYDPAAGFWETSLFVPCEGAEGELCTNPDGIITFNDQSFVAQKPPDVLRIVAFGGSSVKRLQTNFVDLSQRLTARSSTGLRVEIINCGGNSYGSTRVLNLVREMIPYEPDLFLVYSGHNEFEDLYQLRHTPRWSLGLQQTLKHSAFYRLLRDLALLGKARWRLRDPTSGWTDSFDRDRDEALNYPFTHEDIQERMTAYRDNLQSIIDQGRDAGAEVILGTVPSNLRNPIRLHDSPIYGELDALYRAGHLQEAKHRTARLLCETSRHQASAQENHIIRHVSEMNGCRLVDVERAVELSEPNHIPGETLFSDHCHLNDQGNRIWIQAFEPEILRWFDDVERRRL
jgi:hypothetical protein